MNTTNNSYNRYNRYNNYNDYKNYSSSAGGYKNLAIYRQAEMIYDFTSAFCKEYIDYKSRTNDQMVQAARSGKQNIAEGYMQKSMESRIKLLGVARGSLEELLNDYQDFLRQRNLNLWQKDDPRCQEIRKLVYNSYNNYNSYKDYLSSPEAAANCMVTLINQTNLLLDGKLRWTEENFIKTGGFRENLFQKRKAFLKNITVITIITIITVITIIKSQIFAQEGSTNYGTAITYKVVDTKYEDGDIVSLTDQNETLALSKKEYDQRMFGVIVTNPVMVFRRPIPSGAPILRDGQLFVNVTNLNGDIGVGDYLTSSNIPGKAMKATSLNSYVLGIALSNFNKSGGTQVDFNGKKINDGKVYTALGIGPASPIINKASGGLFGTLRTMSQALFYNISDNAGTDKIIRYLIALLIILITVILNYRTFGRNISKGIEAIGRNPLAKASIQTMIIINGVLVAVVTIVGVILALAVISL